jgi:hypothetical protein
VTQFKRLLRELGLEVLPVVGEADAFIAKQVSAISPRWYGLHGPSIHAEARYSRLGGQKEKPPPPTHTVPYRAHTQVASPSSPFTAVLSRDSDFLVYRDCAMLPPDLLDLHSMTVRD